MRTEAGAGTRCGRGDGESARASRVPAAALPAHGGGQRGPPGSPCTHLGAPAPNPVPRSGSSFPPCPGDFSAPESRSLGQVPPAASSPRGTPWATPLLSSHWLDFTPVIFQLAEGVVGHANQDGPAAAPIGWRYGSGAPGLGSDWSLGPASNADAGRAPGASARRAACRGYSRGGGGRGDPLRVLCPLGLRLRRAPEGTGGALGRSWGHFLNSLGLGAAGGGPVS